MGPDGDLWGWMGICGVGCGSMGPDGDVWGQMGMYGAGGGSMGSDGDVWGRRGMYGAEPPLPHSAGLSVTSWSCRGAAGTAMGRRPPPLS